MLEANDISVKVGAKMLLEGVSFMVDDGQVLCISGAKGVGKTSLLRALLGLMPVAAGFVCVDGELLTPLSAPYFRRMVSYVPQRLRLLRGYDRTADFYLQSEYMGTRWGELGAADRYLLLLDKAMGQRREILLLDEPEEPIGEDATGRVAERIGEAARMGAAVVVVSNSEAIINIANQVYTCQQSNLV